MELVQYVTDHALYVIDNLNKNSSSLKEFITSIDIAILIEAGFTTQDSIDDIMKKILFELSNTTMKVKEKKNTYLKKNGELTQNFRFRQIEFNKSLMVYHNQHIDGSIPVNPHFHIVSDPKSRMGKNYQYLRQTLENLALLSNIKFHFMMESRETGLSNKQEKVIDTMAMTLQRGTQDEISTYLQDDKVYTSLELLDIHYANSQNLSYFLKQISILNKCLRDIDLDLEYKNINLKNEIYFDLTQSQYEKIMLLKSDEKIHLDLHKILDREILKSAFGFESIVMNILKEKFEIDEISQDNLTYSIPPLTRRKKQKALDNSNFYKSIQLDIRNALSVATSFYRFREMMRKMEYLDIKVKWSNINRHTQKKTGFTLTTKKHSVVDISFEDLGLNWPRIMKIFAYNVKKNKKLKSIESKLKNYKKKKIESEKLVHRYVCQVNELFKIKYGQACKFNLYSKPLLEGFEIQYSEIYNITTYKSNDIVIVDYPDSLEIKKCNNLSKGIDSIIKFLPANSSVDDLDITVHGSNEYVNLFNKKMENTDRAKRLKKHQVLKPKFKI